MAMILSYESSDLNSNEVQLSRDISGSPDSEESLFLEVIETGERIEIFGQFNSRADNLGLEEIEFADGVTFDRDAIQQNVIYQGGNGDDSIFGSDGDDVILGGKGNDNLFGGEGSDKLNGGAGDDDLEGENGRDILIGGRGNDDLFGGDGNDVLKGGNGNDLLDGEAGRDKLIGGSGADIFVFSEGYDSDRIIKFEQGVDKIQLDDELWGFENLTTQEVINTYGSLNNSGKSLTFNFGDGDVLKIINKSEIDVTSLESDILII
ncbi:Leukotoxin [Nymphon striatum]|nr:Leukotoxin [Nymphon striatum]